MGRPRIESNELKAPVVYGKKKSTLLSLTGHQFMRPDIFSAQSQNDHDTSQGLRNESRGASSSADSSFLDCEPTEFVTSKSSDTSPYQRPGLPALTPDRSRHQGPAKRPGRNILHKRQPLSTCPAPPCLPALQGPSKRNVKPAEAPRPPKRRLPVNKLVLVANTSDLQSPYTFTKQVAELTHHDPTAHFDLVRNGSPSDSDDQLLVANTKAPVTIHRKRLKALNRQHKSINKLRRQQKLSSPSGCGSPRYSPGDGFEASELTINYHPRLKTRHMRKQRQPLWQGLQALSLATGPLPEIDFEKERNEADAHEPRRLHLGSLDDPFLIQADKMPPHNFRDRDTQLDKRSVSFQERVNKLVIAELSSVSAPRREYSVSDDGDEDLEDADTTESCVDGLEEAGKEDDADVSMLSDDERSFLGHSYNSGTALGVSKHAQPGPTSLSPNQQATIERRGVFLDFRRSSTGVAAPSLRLNQRRLAEVDEMIDEVPEDINPGNDNEMLLEDTVQSDGAEELVEEDVKVDTVSQVQDPIQPPVIDLWSTSVPRSILKNQAMHLQVNEVSSRPESTAANTCLNSTVETQESIYFSNAIHQLDSSPPARIIRKKSNDCRYGSYQVLDSDYLVTETSPEPIDYTEVNQLNVLKEQQGTIWSSNRVLGHPRDLKALTRSVSREHGTLSQSVRRRISMPFRSPRPVQ